MVSFGGESGAATGSAAQTFRRRVAESPAAPSTDSAAAVLRNRRRVVLDVELQLIISLPPNSELPPDPAPVRSQCIMPPVCGLVVLLFRNFLLFYANP